ncbi:MAG: hypothetical protein CM1200mP3_05150 [Chloroflexota bacterium]|nr:MAG: hypothetical protein CM1200mP3_05150 [Chloroflexota bacterium]
MEPTRSGITLLVWVMPPFALIIAGTAVFLTLMRMRGNRNSAQIVGVEGYLDEDVTKYAGIVKESKERD